MNKFYNRHYIIIDNQKRITAAWSDGPHPDRDTAGAILLTDQGGYQFRLFPDGEENPALYDWDGMIPLYKYEDGQVIPRAQEEIEADRADIPAPPPSEQEDLAALAVDHEYRLTLLELGLTE